MAFVQNPTDQQKIETEYNKDRRQTVKDENTKVPVYYLKKGKTLLRVLPPFNAEGVWFREYLEHKLPLGGKTVGFSCPRPTGASCPICDKGEALSIAGDQSYRDFQPKRTYLFNVIVLSDPSGITAKDGVKVLKAGVTVKKEIVDLDRAFSEGYGDVTNLQKGFTLSVERTGETMKDTRYNVKPFREPTDITEVLKAQNVDPSSFSQFNLNDAVPAPRPDDEMIAAIEGKTKVFGFPTVVKAHAGLVPQTPQATAAIAQVFQNAPAIQVAQAAQPAIQVTAIAVPVIPDPPSA